MRSPLFDRRPQRGARAEQVRLADELLELRGRTRTASGRPLAPSRSPPGRGPRPIRARILVEEGLHVPEYPLIERANLGVCGRLPGGVVEGVDSVS